jgi:3-methyladenine DNA glycosylase AlkD
MSKKPTVREVLAWLRALADPRARAAQARFGIPTDKSLGLNFPTIRRLAREVGRDHRLAQQLWDSGIHEARHLAFLVAEPEKVTEAQMERWARQFDSWDIVDGTCRYLFLYTPFAWKKAVAWSRRREEFVRRAGFALMAYLAIHDKRAPDAQFQRLLPLILRAATDERNFVKKAVNWALRQIGKRNRRLNRAALRAGERIRRMDSPAARWVAAGALRELRSAAVQRRLRIRQLPLPARPPKPLT